MASAGQTGFFDNKQPKSTEIAIKDDHELVILSDSVDWPEQISAAHQIRASKVKVLCGPEPRYRELLGAITLKAIRNITYRQAEDLIAHYAPARYLCGLMDSTWRPDHVTIFEFTQMMGPEGMDILNRNALLRAQSLGLLDASRLMSDTTAQEAMIPYSIVRGKAGKSVEFGLKWGINRVDGFVLGFLINNGEHVSDQKFCIQAIKEHIELFGAAPVALGFDRGGYSKINIKRAKKLGVKDVGIAPTGKAAWAVSENKVKRIRCERAQAEGSIGTAKSKKYGFNKP